MHAQRVIQLKNWLAKQLSITPPELTTVSGDASFRRYYRFNHNATTYIAVDAPPKTEKNQLFEKIGLLLAKHQLTVPELIHIDLDQGFLLLKDLGDNLLYSQLHAQQDSSSNNIQRAGAESAEPYYQRAILELLKLQNIPFDEIAFLDRYDHKFLAFELSLFNDWFLEKHLKKALSASQIQLLQSTFEQLIESALSQHQCMVHRDFHSRNLMLPEQTTIAVIDFQDAVIGPVSYDLVSLLKDCYLAWPRTKQLRWLGYYYEKAIEQALFDVKFGEFVRQFDWMGMQRHIKVLGIFSRLKYRDGKSSYIKDIPLTLKYLLETSSLYPEFRDFHQFLANEIQPLIKV